MVDFQSLLERRLDPVGVSGNEVIYLCPECDDKSGHLYVNFDKNVFNCVRCRYSGRLPKLIRKVGLDLSQDYDKLYSEQEIELDKIIQCKSRPTLDTSLYEYSTDLSVLTDYYKLHTKPLSYEAYSYLKDRGLLDYTINKLNICEGVNRYGETLSVRGRSIIGRDYSGRVMVPSMRRDGLISFYVGRDYIGGKRSKYLNPPKELGVASEDVWNLDMVDSDSVIICEGVMTAIAASPIKMNSVATYGKSIAIRSSDTSGIRVTSQGEKLLSRGFKNYYVAYDADAYLDSIKTCHYLYERGANVYLVKIDPKKYGPKADIADIGYQEFLNLLSKSLHYTGGLSTLI